MQYSFVAAALVASAVASYAPPAYEPVAPVYPVETKPAEAPVYPIYTKPVHAANSTKTEIVYKPTAPVYPTHGDKTVIVYPTHGADKGNNGDNHGASTKTACTYAAKITTVTLVETITKVVDNKPTEIVTSKVETKTIPVSPVPSGPAKGDDKPSPPVYKPAGNGTTGGNASPSGGKVYPTEPVKYTGAASSLSVAGFVAGAGAIAAFFL